MIDREEFHDWHDLQNSVCRLLQDVGLRANTEVNIGTPRGSVEVDVYAIDTDSLDNISYVIECKNWNAKIPQTIVHAFTAVMHETGANIGYLITKRGLQSGAESYIKNTNIHGLTYKEFQVRYFPAWWDRYFCPSIGNAADRVNYYTEEFNTYRDEMYSQLPEEKKLLFDELRVKYCIPFHVLSMFNMKAISPLLDTGTLLDLPSSATEFESKVLNVILPYIEWSYKDFRELHLGILNFIGDIEAEFNGFFGRYIF